CAADLLAQAEHDPLAKPVLITTSETLAREIKSQLNARVLNLDRVDIAKASLNNQGVIAIVDSIEDAIELSNSFAPEHLSISVRNATSIVPEIRNAGMVFLGEYSHEVLGDYGVGPSHVMPTAGTAKFNSGLGIHTFIKNIPVVNISIESALEMTPHASIIAREEGLTGHAEAAELRQELL
ncbi:MAG: histidinol dehydrogenase, partial [Chloroflexota bacterium]|nr:histidinol dehydrogenase [Chloroflexota bacterium]